MTCQWQTGFLIAQPCGLPAMGACALCGRAICPAHMLPGQAGPACPQCAAHRDDYPDNEDTEMAESRERYYSEYGAPPAFGDANYFSGADTSAFQQTAFPQRPPRQPGYDPMET
jgi:hypothetical protein